MSVDKQGIYKRQVQLLVQTLPVVFREKCFALKGGTAINLFIRDLPRLSVDIDLVYLPHADRDEALTDIRHALARIADNLVQTIPHLTIHRSFDEKVDALRLVVGQGDVRIKIELSPVLRGCVFEPELRAVSTNVEDMFGFVEAPLVSFADLYGGRICAALDRQHPRDLFDMKLLFDHEGLNESVRKAALVYIISHPRPISELLSPHLLDITDIYHHEFSGMTRVSVSLPDLLQARQQLIEQLGREMPGEEREFLLGFKAGNPDWKLLGLNGIERLPAVRWRQMNLEKMPPAKRQEAIAKLGQVLGLTHQPIKGVA